MRHNVHVGITNHSERVNHLFKPIFAPAQVATVLQAESDDDERIVDLEKYHLDCSNVQETDVKALINNRRLAVVLNLTGCKW